MNIISIEVINCSTHIRNCAQVHITLQILYDNGSCQLCKTQGSSISCNRTEAVNQALHDFCDSHRQNGQLVQAEYHGKVCQGNLAEVCVQMAKFI